MKNSLFRISYIEGNINKNFDLKGNCDNCNYEIEIQGLNLRAFIFGCGNCGKKYTFNHNYKEGKDWVSIGDANDGKDNS